MKRCQPVYVGVVDVSSLSEQRCHLLPVSGGASGHKHGSLGESDFRPPRPGNGQGFPGLRSRPIRLRTQPSLQLILPSLFGSFGPGMVSGRHLPWSDSAHGTRRSGVGGLDGASPGLCPLVDTHWKRTMNFNANFCLVLHSSATRKFLFQRIGPFIFFLCIII